MTITRISIQNFRSIKTEIIEPSEFNIFVGQNNHGKTNIFEAIEWFFNKPKKDEIINDVRHGRTGNEEVFVEIEFSGAQNGLKSMKNEGNMTKIAKLLGESDIVSVKRSSNDVSKRILYIDGVEKEAPTGFDNALNDFLPKFEYVDTKKYYEDLAKFGRTATPISTMLSGVLETLLETNDDYKDFRTKFEDLFKSEKSEIKIELDKLSGKVKVYLEKQFPDCVKVEFTVGEPSFEDLLKNFDITIHDGIETNANEKGDGMQRALMLAIIQTYADYRRDHDDNGKNFLFFIDEAELHLHPTAQRKLKNALYELSEKSDQVFINTHSSVFVADDLPHQTIFCVEKANNVTTAEKVALHDKQAVVYDLLGGNPADLLLPRNFLIVEGRSDETFIKTIIKRFYDDKPIIQIIFAGGDLGKQAKSMDAINAAYIPLGVSSSIYKEKLVILCDKPVDQKKETNKQEFLKAFPHLSKTPQHFEIPFCDIEEYYPTPWKKTKTDIKAMDETMNGKMLYAKEVGEKITKEQFEKDMSVVFDALKQCWDLAY